MASSVNNSACSGNRLWMKMVDFEGSRPAATQSMTMSNTVFSMTSRLS